MNNEWSSCFASVVSRTWSSRLFVSGAYWRQPASKQASKWQTTWWHHSLDNMPTTWSTILEKIVGTPDAIYYNYPHAHQCSRKWGMTFFNRKQSSCFYHNPSQPPSNQCWGIWQGFWKTWLGSTLHQGKGVSLFPKSYQVSQPFFPGSTILTINSISSSQMAD